VSSAAEEARTYLASRGIEPATMTAAGLRVTDGRVWFPWLDPDGNEIYATGRSFNGAEPKYMHTRGERPPLYASPGAWQSTRVVLVEGQIDALACAQAGTPAFACSGALTDAALEILRTRTAVILALDADDAGARLREKAVDALAGRVELLDAGVFPEDCKDPGEVIAGTDDPGEEMASVLDRATLVEPPREPDVHAFMAQDDGDYNWQVPGAIEHGDRVVLTGREGAGKSLFLIQLSVQVAGGFHPFDGSEIPPVRVAYVDLENPAHELRRRLRALLLKIGDRLVADTMFVYSRPEGLDLGGDVDDRAWIRERLERTGAGLLVVGPVYKLTDGNPNDEQDMKPVVMFLDELRVEFGVSVALEAHLPNDTGSGRPFGWSGWRRWPEIGLELKESGQLLRWRTPRHETPGIPAALHRGGEWPFTVATNPRDVLWARIVEHCQKRLDRPSVRELASVFGVGKSTVQRVVDERADEWRELFDD
jgi:AAA domain/Toprim-like